MTAPSSFTHVPGALAEFPAGCMISVAEDAYRERAADSARSVELSGAAWSEPAGVLSEVIKPRCRFASGAEIVALCATRGQRINPLAEVTRITLIEER